MILENPDALRRLIEESGVTDVELAFYAARAPKSLQEMEQRQHLKEETKDWELKRKLATPSLTNREYVHKFRREIEKLTRKLHWAAQNDLRTDSLRSVGADYLSGLWLSLDWLEKAVQECKAVLPKEWNDPLPDLNQPRQVHPEPDVPKTLPPPRKDTDAKS